MTLLAIGVSITVAALLGSVQGADSESEGVRFSESFEDTKLAKRGWYDGSQFRIVDEAVAGEGCIEYEWIDGEAKVQGSSPMRRLFEPTDQIAIRFYMKLSKGWGWSGRKYHPHLTHFLTTENSKWHGPAASHLTLYIEPVAGKLRLAAQDIQNAKSPHGLTQGPLRGGYNGTFFDSQEQLFRDDQWHCVEAFFKLNTLDLVNDRPNRDGIVRGWFDGKLVIERADVILRSTDFPNMKFNQFLMAPYFGAGLLPHAQKLWIDELAVGTTRIGPLSGVEQELQSRTASDWPQWRGPNRDGTVIGFSIPDVWPESLDEQWSVTVGDGYSSPVVADGRVYQLSRQGEEEHVRCLELETGKTTWHARYPAAGAVHSAAASHGIGPKSTPVVARGKLYTLGIGNILSCFESHSGELQWRKTFEGRFSKPAPSCGTSMSPLVDGNLCIVHVGHDRDGAMYALDADTGQQQWEYDGDGPGYGSPIIVALAGTRQIVTPVSKFVAGIGVDSGKVLWREPFPTFSTQNVITPLVHRDTIITGGIGQPTVALRPGQGEGNATIERIWENKAASLHMSTPVLLDGRLFGLSRMKSGHLFCLDANTGETVWQGEGRFAKNAAVLVVGNLLAILTSEGKLVFAKPTDTGLDYLAEYPVDPSGRAWAHLALVGRRILVKGDEDLICWSLPAG